MCYWKNAMKSLVPEMDRCECRSLNFGWYGSCLLSSMNSLTLGLRKWQLQRRTRWMSWRSRRRWRPGSSCGWTCCKIPGPTGHQFQHHNWNIKKRFWIWESCFRQDLRQHSKLKYQSKELSNYCTLKSKLLIQSVWVVHHCKHELTKRR